MNYQELTQNVTQLVRQVGVFVMEEYTKLNFGDIIHKNKNDLVSYVDIETENKLMEGLGVLLPGSEFLAEESSGNRAIHSDTYYWIIDPVDGTTNFVYKIPVFCMSVALYRNNEILSGVVFDPIHDEIFCSWKGGSSYLNNKTITVNSTKQLGNALLATGFPYNRFDKLDNIVSILKDFLLTSQDVRRLGAAALDMCYVACGRFDGFWEFLLKPWDVAAASLIVQNAGGHVTDFNNGENFLFNGEIVAAVPGINKQMREVIRKHYAG